MKLSKIMEIENCGDAGFIFSLKENIPRKELLKFKGFGVMYNMFKIWNLDKSTAIIMFIDTETNKSWTANWGSSTTLTSDNVWEQRNALLKYLAEEFPETKDMPRMRKYDGRLLYV